MTTAYWCVFVIILFPYIFTVLAKTDSRFNNQDPRKYLDEVSGWRRRANCTQLNSFESGPAFGIAVIIAHLTHVYQPSLDNMALAFVGARCLYAICYLFNKPLLRTLFWAVGFGCMISLFFLEHV